MITVNVDDIEALVTEMNARGIEAKAHCARPRPLASRAHHPIRMETFRRCRRIDADDRCAR